jgi:hypothetical protein
MKGFTPVLLHGPALAYICQTPPKSEMGLATFPNYGKTLGLTHATDDSFVPNKMHAI